MYRDYAFTIQCIKYPTIQYDRVVKALNLPQALRFISRNYKIGTRWNLLRLELSETPKT